MIYNFKCVECYNYVKLFKFLVCFWILVLGIILGLVLMMLFIFNNIGIILIIDFMNCVMM